MTPAQEQAFKHVGASSEPGSLRSRLEIVQSLKREGWTEDCTVTVFKSSDGRLAKCVWPDGKTLEMCLEQNAKD